MARPPIILLIYYLIINLLGSIEALENTRQPKTRQGQPVKAPNPKSDSRFINVTNEAQNDYPNYDLDMFPEVPKYRSRPAPGKWLGNQRTDSMYGKKSSRSRYPAVPPVLIDTDESEALLNSPYVNKGPMLGRTPPNSGFAAAFMGTDPSKWPTRNMGNPREFNAPGRIGYNPSAMSRGRIGAIPAPSQPELMQMPPINTQFMMTGPNERMMAGYGYSYRSYIERQSRRYPIMIYTLVQCVPCNRAKHMLATTYPDVASHYLELVGNEDWQRQLQVDLHQMTGQITFPYIFVCGEFIGGSSNLFDMHKAGQLRTVLNACPPRRQ